MLIVLPSHLRVSGVTTWAMRGIDALRSRGIESGLLVHTHPGQPVPGFLSGYVEGVVECDHPIEELDGQIDGLVERYGRVISAMHERTRRPVVIVPCLHGDAFGVVASLTQTMPGIVRPVAWIHADNRYDLTVAVHYEPVVCAFGCVSRELAEQTAAQLPGRASDVFRVPNPVGVVTQTERSPFRSTRSVRLVYTGRIDEPQKRVSALPWIARTLHEQQIGFELRVVGDGDAMDTLREQSQSISGIELLGSVDPDRVAEHLAWADLWVLPSRYEGQSVAMLEAMACGCVPLVTRVRSGMNESIVDGESGIVVDCDEDATGEQAGRAMGRAIARARTMDLGMMSERAQAHIAREHNPTRFADRLVEIVERASAMPDPVWPAERPAAFTGGIGVSGSTPWDAGERMACVLRSLSGRRVAIYGAGRHTIDLIGTISASPAHIVCIIDDEPTRWGATLGELPIVSIEDAPSLDLDDVVLSSWMHEDRLFERTLKRLPTARVHRLYHAAPTRSSIPAHP
ncbi:MAG: glycosyltransferase [Phycisphaerales bacterium]|nr:glycosyltransferase [Phycisphaerales bacterium]